MVRNRRGLAPWSLAREAGIESATDIDVSKVIGILVIPLDAGVPSTPCEPMVNVS